jgi:hypothetical protein
MFFVDKIRDLYKWAATIFSSRSFISPRSTDETHGVLFPMIDCFNHEPSAKAVWEFDESATFTISFDDEIYAGNELLNNYGFKSNEECR